MRRALPASRNNNIGTHTCVLPACPPACRPPPAAQDDDIPGVVRYRTYEVLKDETANPRLRWAYLPYSMHMAGPREAIQHMIIRKNYGEEGDGGGAATRAAACLCCTAQRAPTCSLLCHHPHMRTCLHMYVEGRWRRHVRGASSVCSAIGQ